MTSLIKRTTQYISLQGGTDIELSTVLTSLGAPNRHLIIELPADKIIGSTSKSIPAFRTGDLNQYPSVTLNIYGEIQGKEGAANSGNAGNAFDITSEIEVNIMSGGAIRGGGGGGGVAGAGASGNNAGTYETRYDYSYLYYWVTYNDSGGINCGHPTDGQKTSRLGCRKHNDDIGTPCGYGWIRWGSSVYRQGAYRAYNYPYPSDPKTGKVNLYELSWAAIITGSRGSGGNGGAGQGYGNPTVNSGSTGSYGSYSAGKGGTGGSGGLWGVGGNTGNTGGYGSAFYDAGATGKDGMAQRCGRTTTTNGYGGAGGGAAGAAITGSISTGSTINNNGTINGAIT